MERPVLFEKCKFLMALPEHGGIRTGYSVLTEGRHIRAVGPHEEVMQAYPDAVAAAAVVDCRDKIVMPGLVDGHNHLCNTHMNLARIVYLNYADIAGHMMATIHDPYGWMTDECLYDISMASILCDVKNGATTIENSTIKPDVAARAMKDAKIRGILAPQMATSFRLQNDDLNWQEMLARTEDNIRAYHDPENGMSVVVHVHDLWDTLEEVMHRGLAMARQYSTRYVTHFWEFANAVERADEVFRAEGGAMAHYLSRGLVDERCVLFHGSRLTEEDIDVIAETGASIIHNPDINGTNCGNCAYIPYMLEKGINIGLGSDYGSLDIKTAMKLMLFVHNVMPRQYKGLAPHAPLRAATMGGAKAYGLDHLTGALEAGKRADIITYDFRAASHLLPMASSVIAYDASILYFIFARNAAGMPTSETMIDGLFVRKDGRFTALDEDAITKKAAAWCEQFIPDLMKTLDEGRHYARRVHEDFTRDEALDLEALLKV